MSESEVPSWIARDHGVPPESRVVPGSSGTRFLWPDGRTVTTHDPLGRIVTIRWSEPGEEMPRRSSVPSMGLDTSGMNDDEVRAAARRRQSMLEGA